MQEDPAQGPVGVLTPDFGVRFLRPNGSPVRSPYLAAPDHELHHLPDPFGIVAGVSLIEPLQWNVILMTSRDAEATLVEYVAFFITVQ